MPKHRVFSYVKFKGYGVKWDKSVTVFAAFWGGSKTDTPQKAATFRHFFLMNQYSREKSIYI